MPRQECVGVELRRGEEARRLLYRKGLLIRGLKPARAGDMLLLPVHNATEAVQLLSGESIRAEPCTHDFEEIRRAKAGRPPIGYLMVGHVVIINPVKGVEDLEYYRSMAEDLLRTVKPAKSVYLKKGTHGQYRVAKLIHLAGVDDTKTVHREYGLVFHMDLSKVYYNPRLAAEHRRIAERVDDGENVLDMFSGVGGFSIHIAALARARVLAVDINHYAAAYAAINVRANKKRLVGEVAVLRADAARLPEIHDPVFNRIIMNNPTMARKYASIACLMARGRTWLHYYTLTISRLEAEDEVSRAFSPCGVEVIGSRQVLDFSPEMGVYAVDAVIVGRGK